MRMNYKKYNSLSLSEKREFINLKLNNEFEFGEDFEEYNGDLETEIEIMHKECGNYDYITLKDLFARSRKCPECFRVEREENFKELIKEKYELKSKYYNAFAPIKVFIKKCGHIQKVKPHSALNAVKNNTNIECKECVKEKKINTLKKHLRLIDTFEGEFKFKNINKDNTIDVIHTRCNKTLNFKYKNIIDHDVSCYDCKEEDRQQWFIDKLYNKYNVSKDFKLYKPYIDSTRPVYLEHKCGYVKRISVPSLELLEEIKCNVCDLNQFNNTKELTTLLYKYTKGEYAVAKDYNGEEEIFLRRKQCGHVFFTKPKQFFKNPICPKCEEEKELSKRHMHFKESLYKKYGTEYDIATQYRTYTTSVELIHNTCGTIFTDIPARVLKTKTKEPCPVCNKLGIKSKNTRINRHLNSLYEKYQDEFSLTGEYINSRTETTYKHNLCGCEFNATPVKMLKRKYKCKNCVDGVPIEDKENHINLETC